MPKQFRLNVRGPSPEAKIEEVRSEASQGIGSLGQLKRGNQQTRMASKSTFSLRLIKDFKAI